MIDDPKNIPSHAKAIIRTINIPAPQAAINWKKISVVIQDNMNLTQCKKTNIAHITESHRCSQFFARLPMSLRRGNVVMFFDYDGTLALFVARASEASQDEIAGQYLKQLRVKFGNQIVIVTGRPAREIDKFLGKEFNVIGQHGTEIRYRRIALNYHRYSLIYGRKNSSKQKKIVGQISGEFKLEQGDIYLEPKQFSFDMHWRPLSTRLEGKTARLEEIVLHLKTQLKRHLPPIEGFELHLGEMCLKYKLNKNTGSKGTAITSFLAEHPKFTQAVFFGDEFRGTDADAAQALNELKLNTTVIHITQGEKSSLADTTIPSPKVLGRCLKHLVKKIQPNYIASFFTSKVGIVCSKYCNASGCIRICYVFEQRRIEFTTKYIFTMKINT